MSYLVAANADTRMFRSLEDARSYAQAQGLAKAAVVHLIAVPSTLQVPYVIGYADAAGDYHQGLPT